MRQRLSLHAGNYGNFLAKQTGKQIGLDHFDTGTRYTAVSCCVCFVACPHLDPQWLVLLCATARSLSQMSKPSAQQGFISFSWMRSLSLVLKLFVVILLRRKAISRSGLQHLGPAQNPFPALSNGPAKELRNTVDWSVSVLHLSFTMNVYPTACLISFPIENNISSALMVSFGTSI